jgi:hypothetical protein
VDLQAYQSQVVSANQHPATAVFDSSFASSQSQAGFWAVAWIPFAVVGAAGIATGIFTW